MSLIHSISTSEKTGLTQASEARRVCEVVEEDPTRRLDVILSEAKNLGFPVFSGHEILRPPRRTQDDS